MSGLTGVELNKLQGGLQREKPNGDDVSCLIIGCDTTNIAAEPWTPYEITQILDAENLGLTAAFDANNELLVYHHISEFLRNAPDAKLYFIAGNIGDSDYSMLGTSVPLLRNKSIRLIAIANGEYEPNTSHNECQAIINALSLDNIFIDAVLLEGNGVSFREHGDSDGLPISIVNYDDLRQLNCPNVSTVICQDPIQNVVLGTEFNNSAAMGTVLGQLAVRGVHENLGSTDIERKPKKSIGSDDYPLDSEVPLRFPTAHLTNGIDTSLLSNTDLESMTLKGYILAAAFSEYSGFFLNGSPTSVELVSDYAYIEQNRIWNKAARGVRAALIPRVRSSLRVNPTTGYLLTSTAVSLEEIAKKPLQSMLTAEEISGYKIYINPAQSPNDATPLVVKLQILANSILHEFAVNIGFASSL